MELIKHIDETFKFNDKKIRIIGTYDEPWFVAKDICDILGLTNVTETLKNIPENWRSSETLRTSYNSQTMNIINEAAVYRLIMRSNKPIAQKFQEVVCGEILPMLRKKGEYKIQAIIDKNKQLEEETQKLKGETKLMKNDYDKLVVRHNKHLKKIKRTPYEIGSVVYIVSNPVIPKMYFKIGLASQKSSVTQSSFMRRLSTYNTSSPHDFVVNYLCYVKYNTLIEKLIKIKFEKNLDPLNKEWIQNVKLETIIEYIKYICDGSNINYFEHTYVPDNKMYNEDEDNEEEDNEEEDNEDTEDEEDNEDEDNEVEDNEEDNEEVEVEDNDEVEDNEVEDEEDNEVEDNEVEDNEVEDEEEEIIIPKEDELEIRQKIIVNESNSFQELQAMCKKYKLDERGNLLELYNRVLKYKETGKKTVYRTLSQLQEECKKNNLFHTGNKNILEERLEYFYKTGKNIRYIAKEKKETIGNAIYTNNILSNEEKENLLLKIYYESYDNLKLLCSKYKILQDGTKDELIVRLKWFLNSGVIDSDRRKSIYLYNENGVFIKFYNTQDEASEDLNISKNIICAVIDQNCVINNYIIRKNFTQFSIEELIEINKDRKKVRKNLTSEDHLEIKRIYDLGEKTKAELMQIYNLSNTQMKRIINKKNE